MKYLFWLDMEMTGLEVEKHADLIGPDRGAGGIVRVGEEQDPRFRRDSPEDRIDAGRHAGLRRLDGSNAVRASGDLVH